MKIIAIIFSVSIVFCQSEDLVDDRLSWLLTNPDNIDKLDEDKSKIIKSELSKILEKFNNEVKEKNIFTQTTVKEVVSTSSTLDKDEYWRLRKGGMNEMAAEMHATKIRKYTRDAIKTRGFDLNVRLSAQIPEWSDIVEYYGGYSELTGVGIKKEDLQRFRVNKELKRVEIADGNRCVAIIETNGEKDYGLKFYDLERTQQMIFGTYQLDDFTITDLYYISKSDRDNSPKIEFTFTDQELVQSKQDVFIKSVIDINNKIVELSKPYLNTIEMMINDLVPLSYYNTFSHRKGLIQKQIENQRQLERKAKAAKVAAKQLENFKHFKRFDKKRSLAIKSTKYPLFVFMGFNDEHQKKKRKKKRQLIKKYERQTNKDVRNDESQCWPCLNINHPEYYTDDFLEYYYNSLKKDADADIKDRILATREQVNEIGAATNCEMLRIATDYVVFTKANNPRYPFKNGKRIFSIKQCSIDQEHKLPLSEWLPGINE